MDLDDARSIKKRKEKERGQYPTIFTENKLGQ